MDKAAATISQNRQSAGQPDLGVLKARQQAAWSSGDYALIGTTLQIVGEELCEALDVRSGAESARRGRRQRQRLPCGRPPRLRGGRHRLRAGAARARPRARGCRAARPGASRGRCGGAAVCRRQLRRGGLDLRRHVHARPGPRGGRADPRVRAAAAGSASPTGRRKASSARSSRPSASTCRRRPASGRLRCGARGRGSPSCSSRTRASIKSAQRHFVFRYRSPEHWLHFFKTYYGPMLKAFAALEPAGQSALQRDLLALVREFNRSGDDSMVVPSEYLEVVIVRA